MSLIVVTYCKGFGGATTTAVGLAAVAPVESRAVLVECDPSGGDLMRRHGLAGSPGLVDLAAASREGAARRGEAFASAEQRIQFRDRMVDVVVAPPGGAQARAALGELTRPGNTVLGASDRLVIADCGRWESDSMTGPLLAAAEVVLVLVRARADELAHLRERLGSLVGLTSDRLVVVLTPGGVYSAGEVCEVLTEYLVRDLAAVPDGGFEVVGPLPEDRRAVGVLGGDLLPGRRWRHLPLLSALSRLLEVLGPRLSGRAPVDGVIR